MDARDAAVVGEVVDVVREAVEFVVRGPVVDVVRGPGVDAVRGAVVDVVGGVVIRGPVVDVVEGPGVGAVGGAVVGVREAGCQYTAKCRPPHQGTLGDFLSAIRLVKYLFIPAD